MTQVTAAVKSRVEAKLRKCHAMAEKHYGQKFDFPSIHYTVRGVVAGKAYGTKKVNFNPVLLMENTNDFIARTVPHELAHCIDYVVNSHNHIRYGRKRDVHGAAWRRVMAVIGASDATRCHQYDVTNAVTRKRVRHEWVCNDCGAKMELGPKRHKKMQAADEKGCYRPGKSHCSWSHTYTYVGVVGTPKPAAPKKAAPKKSTASHKSPNKGSKKARAEAIYMGSKVKDRTEIIKRFMTSLDMTAAGAATYYANCKKKFG